MTEKLSEKKIAQQVGFPLDRAFTALVNGYNFFVLQGVRTWRNPFSQDARSFHAVGDGAFIIDGEIVDLRHKMTKWQHCI